MRNHLYEIIFEANTKAGKLFDVVLLWSILLSVVLVALESVKEIALLYGDIIYWGEWFFTILFTIEFLLRLFIVRRRLRYFFSFYGMVDFLSTLPAYITLVYQGGHLFLMIRVLRLLRIFRIFKLVRFTREGQTLMRALLASRPKIVMFLGAVLALCVIVGSLMYVIEGERNGFTSIPRSIYWAIVTLTTVGYGDIAPQTPLGQFLAALVMLAGYGIIAVPTGIMTAEMSKIHQMERSASTKELQNQNWSQPDFLTKACPGCGCEGHDADAVHCKFCGYRLLE